MRKLFLAALLSTVVVGGVMAIAADKVGKKESEVSSTVATSIPKSPLTISMEKGMTGNPTHTTASVSATCAAMEAGGFKTVRGIPCDSEKVRLAVKDFEGKVYKAIEYTGSFRDTYCANSSFTGTRLEELLLVLNKDLDLGVFGGGWLPIKVYGPEAVELQYDKLGPTKVEKVATLKDGRTVLHVAREGSTPYFAVEASKIVYQPKQVVITDYAAPTVCGDVVAFGYLSDLEILKNNGLPADARVKVTGKSKELVGDCYLYSRTLQISWKEAKTLKTVTTYPYYERAQ